MKLSLQIIADKLMAGEVHLRRKSELNLVSPKIIGAHSIIDSADSVYVGLASDILTCRGRENLADIVCIDNDHRARSLLDGTAANMVVVDASHDVISLFNRVQGIFDFYNRCEQELKDAIIRGADLHEIVSASEKLFGNPVFLLDSALMLLAYSCKGREDGLDDRWKATVSQGHVSIDTINSLRERDLLTYFDTLDHAVFFKWEGSVHPDICHNVFLHGKKVASFVIMPVSSEFGEGDLSLAEYLSTVLASVMGKYMDRQYARANHLERLVLEFLAGNGRDTDKMRHYLSLAGWDAGDSYYLLRVILQKNDVQGGTVEYSAELIRRLFRDACLVGYGDDLVAVINETRHRGSLEESFSALAQLLRKRTFKAGLTSRFNDFSAIRDHYRLATAAIEIGNALDADKCLYSFGKYLPYHLIETCAQSMDPISLCHPDVITLSKHDKKNNGALLTSLYTYLVQEKSLAGAAARLGIHRNTLVYRLNKIGDMVDIDLGDEDTKMHLILSYKILDYVYRKQKKEQTASEA